MKTAVAAIFALAGAATVAARDFPESMPDCGRICGTNMLQKAAEFSCGADDVACMCRDERFGYGVHDCSVQACPDVDQANVVIGWGNSLCSSANQPVNIPSATAVAGSGGSPVTSEVVTTVTSGESTFTTTSVTTVSESDEDDGVATAITTSTWTSTWTSGDVTSTVTGETTVSGISGVAGATSVPETTITSPIVSTQTDDSSTFETTIGTSTFVSSVTGDALSDSLSSQASEAASSTESGNAAQMTAAPAFGLMAAAGIAAALL